MIPRGAWHQLGYQSAATARDVFPKSGGGGVGAILSPKDEGWSGCQSDAAQFRRHGKSVMWDPQFFRLDFQNGYSADYLTNPYRVSLHRNGGLAVTDQSGLARALEITNRDLQTAAVIAPAVCVEASNSRSMDINELLFMLAKQAGDALGIPTLASIPIAASASASEAEIHTIIRRVTSWNAGGWYLLYDFDGNAVPSEFTRLQLWARTCLDLAATGKPLILGYQGLLSVVSVGLGAHGIALGQFQTLWHFDPNHWAGTTPGPIRRASTKFFSVPLWHPLRFPDDFPTLPSPQADPFLTPSPWSQIPQARQVAARWGDADARRHFMYTTTQWIDAAMALPTPRERAIHAKEHLDQAMAHWVTLSRLRYQTPHSLPHAEWSALLGWALTNRAQDYDWLDLL